MQDQTLHITIRANPIQRTLKIRKIKRSRRKNKKSPNLLLSKIQVLLSTCQNRARKELVHSTLRIKFFQDSKLKEKGLAKRNSVVENTLG